MNIYLISENEFVRRSYGTHIIIPSIHIDRSKLKYNQTKGRLKREHIKITSFLSLLFAAIEWNNEYVLRMAYGWNKGLFFMLAYSRNS